MLESQTHSHSKTLLVRQNHFSFYKEIAEICSFKTGGQDNFKYLITDKMEWPKMIYDVKPSDHLLEYLSQKILSKELPELLLIDSVAKTEDFDKSAKNSGFIPVMRWPAMIFNLNENKKTFNTPSDFAITLVKDLNDLRNWVSIVNTTLFTKGGIRAEIFEPLLHSDKFAFLVGLYNNIPVSSMLLHYYEKTTGIYMASTIAKYGGKGFMTSILLDVATKAYKNNFEYLTLEANNQSFRLYSSFGFENVGNFDIYWYKNN